MEKRDDADLPSIDWGRADMLIELALNEDLDTVGDVTTNSIIPEDMEGRAVLRCKTDGTVVAGLAIAERVFKLVEPRLEFKTFIEDGESCNAGDEIAAVEGPVRGILTGERTALNFLQRLSGIATTTNRYVQALGDSKTQLLDTRKTTPGYRNLEKYAVAVGGGANHRMGLYDRVMIKDNHRELAALGGGENAIAWAVAQARLRYPDLEIEVEADTVEEAVMAAEEGTYGWLVIFVGIMLSVFQQAVGINAVLYFAPRIFESLGMGNPMMQTVLMGIVNITFTLVAIFTVEKWGRKPLLIWGSLGMALGAAGVAVTSVASALPPVVAVISIMVYSASFMFSWGPICWVLISEIFPNTRLVT